MKRKYPIKSRRVQLRGITVSLIILSAVILSIDYGYSRKVISKFKAPKETASASEKHAKIHNSDGEEFTNVATKLAFVGYDKKSTSGKETFFIGNNSEVDLKGIDIEITYLTTSGKQIHKRTVNLKEKFPAGETRAVDIKSWDTQHSYHYTKSVASKSGSTPYTVRFKVLSFTKE